MERDYSRVDQAIKQLVEAIKQLRQLGVATTQRQLPCEISEWLVEELFGAKRAQNKKQSDWDLLLDGKKIQVKAHSKADTNTNSGYTDIKYGPDADIDELIIIVFSQDLKLNELYRASWKDIQGLITRENKYPSVRWKKLKENGYQVKLDDLPNKHVLELFK